MRCLPDFELIEALLEVCKHCGHSALVVDQENEEQGSNQSSHYCFQNDEGSVRFAVQNKDHVVEVAHRQVPVDPHGKLV